MIRLGEALEPNIKVGTVVQAYGFPILSGFKGENFYKVTRIEGETVYFQRCNQDGQIGNIGLGEFSANMKNVKDAIQSVESGTSTNGLRIWKENKQVLKEDLELFPLLATLGAIIGQYALRKFGPYVLGKIFDGAASISNKIKYIVNPEKWVKFLKELHKNPTFNKQFIDYIQKAGKDKAFSKLTDKGANIFEELPEFNKAIDKFIKDNDIPKDNIEKLKNDIKSGFRNTIQYQAPKVIARLKSDYPELTQNLNEMIVSDKTDGRVKQMMLKIKSSYPSLNALNYDTQNKTYLFAFGKKADADKLEKDFKAARSKNPNKAIGKFEFVRSADYPNDTPPTFVKQFKINESIKEARNMLVYNVNADAVTAFLRKYPKVRTVMTSIAKKNKDITRGYKEFLRFKDKHETELGGRGEIRKSDTFGEKQFYKYDWMGTTGWAEIYQFIHGAKVESVNEGKYYIGYNKGRGQGKGVFKDTYSTYKEAQKEVEKIQKMMSGSHNMTAYYVADKKGEMVKETVTEARGPKLIQREFDKVVGEIETTLQAYKKAKGTPKEKPLIAKLKDLNDRKKSLAAELEDRISGLYKDAELKMSEAYQYPKGKSLKAGFGKTTFDMNKMLKYAKSWKSFYDDFKRKFSSYPKDNQSLADLKDLFGMYHPELSIAEGIEGGKAAGLGLRAIAKMHNFDINDLLQQFKKGVKTEMEHTDKPDIAKEIALDHLVEDPLYYEKIQKIGL